ncbi:MAG: PrsW family intramembrane metalloprotease [Chloroflexi bacterium]|nr:PrsW family intramembrane metalloprotease [Chloroflexota bacterium]
MDTTSCCVCGKPSTRTLGRRPFCDEHYERAIRENRGFWRAGLGSIALLIVFTAVVAAIGSVVSPTLSDSALLVVGLILALVPSVLWLWFFYRQDRLEPEPRGYVIGVFLLAMLVTDAVGRRLLLDVFRVQEWMVFNPTSALVGSILVIVFTLEAIKYAVVRFTVYTTLEFDERMDGIVYGTAAGLGVATMLNLRFVLESGGGHLTPGVIHIVVETLAQASFGGIVGYFLGEAKFADDPFWWLPAGVTLAAVLNGLFLWLIGEINATGIEVSPWRGLILAIVVAALTFAALLWLIRRALAQTVASQPAAGVGQGN